MKPMKCSLADKTRTFKMILKLALSNIAGLDKTNTTRGLILTFNPVTIRQRKNVFNSEHFPLPLESGKAQTRDTLPKMTSKG